MLARGRLVEPEMLRMPRRLVHDRVEQERVDLRQRMIPREPPERVRESRVTPCVVQCVAGLVEERLVVVQPALGAGDQVHQARRVGGDHAGTR